MGQQWQKHSQKDTKLFKIGMQAQSGAQKI